MNTREWRIRWKRVGQRKLVDKIFGASCSEEDAAVGGTA